MLNTPISLYEGENCDYTSTVLYMLDNPLYVLNTDTLNVHAAPGSVRGSSQSVRIINHNKQPQPVIGVIECFKLQW